jgi:hypothetical protein
MEDECIEIVDNVSTSIIELADNIGTSEPLERVDIRLARRNALIAWQRLDIRLAERNALIARRTQDPTSLGRGKKPQKS